MGMHWDLFGDTVELFLTKHTNLLLLFFLACFLLPLLLREEQRILLNAFLTSPLFWFLLTCLILLLINFIKIPEILFGIITLLLVGYWVRNLFFKKTHFIKQGYKIILSVLTIGLSWIWFVPVHVGYIGEVAVCKFRFQVLEFDRHDYGGYGELTDLFIDLRPNKYGTAIFYKKIGGWKEYFGLKKTGTSRR